MTCIGAAPWALLLAPTVVAVAPMPTSEIVNGWAETFFWFGYLLIVPGLPILVTGVALTLLNGRPRH